MKEGEATVKAVGKEFKDTYPTTTYKNFIFNAPAASVAGPLLNAMLPARSRDKTVLNGSKVADELQEYVSPSMLPQKLGGVLDNGNQWEKVKKGKK